MQQPCQLAPAHLLQRAATATAIATATACRWAVLPGEMASKRGGHACVAAGGLLYALGGFDSQQAIPHCEVFDPRVSAPRAALWGLLPEARPLIAWVWWRV